MLMSYVFRFQAVKKLKSGFSITLRSYPFIKNFTLKVGDILPFKSKSLAKPFFIKEISNDTQYSSDFENAYIVISNGEKEYKATYKTSFNVCDDKLEKDMFNYDAHLHLKLELTQLK